MPHPPRFTPPAGFAGLLCLSACGCGAAELAATEDPLPPAPAPFAAPAGDGAPAEPAEPAPAPAPLPAELGWDFFGPPAVAEEREPTGPAAGHLHYRGFLEMDGRRVAHLWSENPEGGGELLLLAAGESAGGVTVVELGGETVTVEHPDRVVLSLSRADPGTAARRPAPRRLERRPTRPAPRSPPRPTPAPASPAASLYAPPPPPPPPPEPPAFPLADDD